MRMLALSIVVVAACGDEGAQLTLSAPSGPTRAASFQIVLATPDQIPVIQNQRVAPRGATTETVSYYLQRTTGGVVSDHGSINGVDGYAIHVEASSTIADKTFIPFVLLYGDNQQLTGIGTFHASGQAAPSPILVKRGEIDKYTLDVEPVLEVDDTAPVGPAQALQVGCVRADQSTFLSGIVWRPSSGAELRVMLPDDPGSTDATARTLDLDCDGHAVTPDDASADCDDSRERFHHDADEACDGEDTNCDGNPYLVEPCMLTAGFTTCTSTTGTALCDDTGSGTLGACQAAATCVCAGTQPGCTRCVIPFSISIVVGDITPCQAGIGVLSTQNLCTGSQPCRVSVLGVKGGWDAAIAANSQTAFGATLTAVGSEFAIQVRRPEGPGASIPGMAGHNTGEVDLVIVDFAGVSHFIAVDLEISTAAGDCTGNGPYQMACSP